MKTAINIGSFVIMIILARLWIEIDQLLLPDYLLLPAFLVIMIILLTIYFFIVKPVNVRRFAFLTSAAVCLIAIFLTILQHVVFYYDFNLVWKKSIIVWVLTFMLPNCIGLGYSKLIKRNKSLYSEKTSST
jgi:prepilin signal peptidase PulO-like enzyme (type II secretory pathway)